MRLAAWVALVLMTGAASATGYDDFSRGLTALARDNPDAAADAFTAALASNDLVEAYRAPAHRGLGRALYRKGKCQDALAEADAAIALAPKDRLMYALRADVKLCLKDFAGARADYTVRVGTDSYGAMQTGRWLWDHDGFGAAAESFAASLAAVEHGQKGVYTLLWYAMTEDRLGHLDPAAVTGYVRDLGIDRTQWPGQLIELYEGTRKDTAVAPLAHGFSAKGERCEANFYKGEWLIARGNKDGAKPLIEAARQDCPHGFIEYEAAKVEAKRLGLPDLAEDTP